MSICFFSLYNPYYLKYKIENLLTQFDRKPAEFETHILKYAINIFDKEFGK